MLGGHAENIAAGLKHRSLARRRNSGVTHGTRDILQMRFERGAVGQNADADLGILFGGQIHQIQPPAALEHHVLGPDVGEVNIQLVKGGDLAKFFLFEIIGPNVGALIFVPIGEEIQSRAMPHRQRVGGVVSGDILCRVGFQVKEPDGRIHAAAITLPGAEICRDRNVSQCLAVG